MVESGGRLTRRRMLGAAGGVALGALAAPALAQRARSANDRVNLAVIGAGGKGADDMVKLTGENIVAICDVDFPYVERSLAGRLRPPRGQTTSSPESLRLQAAYQ